MIKKDKTRLKKNASENVRFDMMLQFFNSRKYAYCMYKKSWSILHKKLLFKLDQDFLDKQ